MGSAASLPTAATDAELLEALRSLPEAQRDRLAAALRAAQDADVERLFVACLRRRAEREALRKAQREERKAVAKRAKEQAMDAAFENDRETLLRLMDEGRAAICQHFPCFSP